MAEYFGVDPKTVRRWIAQGRLTAHRIGPRLIRVNRESIMSLGSPIGSI
ncbi:helix-turn-helix domain-containing protein [Mycobacterium marinum]|nr:helix-turn-helix domain-containing protein [Mycobacterium marinum]